MYSGGIAEVDDGVSVGLVLPPTCSPTTFSSGQSFDKMLPSAQPSRNLRRLDSALALLEFHVDSPALNLAISFEISKAVAAPPTYVAAAIRPAVVKTTIL